MKDKEQIVKICGNCGLTIKYPPGISSAVCMPCPNCGHRSCSSD